MREEWNIEKGFNSSQNKEIRCELGKILQSKHGYLNPANSKIKKDQ